MKRDAARWGVHLERWQILMLVMVGMIIVGLAQQQQFTTLIDALLL